MNWKNWVTVGMVVGALGVGTEASANLISIGLQESTVNGGAITFQTSGANTVSLPGTTTYGTFTSVQVSATGVVLLGLPDLLNSNTVNVSSNTAGTLSIYITQQDIADPVGIVDFSSSYTTNAVTAGLSVTEATFFDAGNALWGVTTPLSSHSFTAIGTAGPMSTLVSGVVGPYSVTHVYTIVVPTGGGNTNDTIDMNAAAVPEPASMLLLGTGLVGLAASARRRLRKNR